MNATSKEFGSKIKAIRESKAFSVRQTALQAGMSASYLSRVENGFRDIPTNKTLYKIADGLRISHEDILKLAGIVPEKLPNELTISSSLSSVSIPIYGRISAGYPEGAVEDIEGDIDINGRLVAKYGTDNLLALRIDGESMNKIAPNGSIAILAKLDTSELKNGDVCGVIINGDSATIKHVYRYPDHIRFEPDSWLSDFKAYEYKTADIENNEPPIQFIGKLVQIINVLDK